ncbi:hypothetical protein Taro_028522 [Colocasia esculenta]|uniref:Uncharacterized protein n=1 Tax=Colocasia esculenta TaxID=4460 RepID=A0A843VQN1_COLES|nr:hypothetical protein [Colocasia esculenta]
MPCVGRPCFERPLVSGGVSHWHIVAQEAIVSTVRSGKHNRYAPTVSLSSTRRRSCLPAAEQGSASSVLPALDAATTAGTGVETLEYLVTGGETFLHHGSAAHSVCVPGFSVVASAAMEGKSRRIPLCAMDIPPAWWNISLAF